jgi:hypothetical protein
VYKNIEHAMKGLAVWKKHRRNKISPLCKNIAFRPTFNADFYRESVFHRFIELVESTYTLYRSEQFLAAIITARSCQETISILNFINIKLEHLSKTEDLKHFVESFKRLTLGFCQDEEFPEKISVMTCIDSVDKKLEGKFRQHYNLLSEYAHPNYSGTFGVFGQPNHETLDVVISPTKNSISRMKKHVELTLMICLELLGTIQEVYEKQINVALETCIEMHEQGKLVEQFYGET